MLPVALRCIWPRFGVSSGGLIVRTLGCGDAGREGRDAAVAAQCCLCTLSQSLRRCCPCMCPLCVGHCIAATNLTFLHPSVVAMRRTHGWRLRAAESSRSGRSAGSQSSASPPRFTTPPPTPTHVSEHGEHDCEGALVENGGEGQRFRQRRRQQRQPNGDDWEIALCRPIQRNEPVRNTG